MEQFSILAMKGVTRLNLNWALVKWSKVIVKRAHWITSNFFIYNLVLWLNVHTSPCRMGPGNFGHVHWWEEEAEDPFKARLWGSGITTYHSRYTILRSLASRQLFFLQISDTSPVFLLQAEQLSYLTQSLSLSMASHLANQTRMTLTVICRQLRAARSPSYQIK